MSFHTCGPNEALVVSGLCHKDPKLVPGGSVFTWPFIQKVQRINLNVMTLNVSSPRIYTKLGVPISVTGVAQVKIESGELSMLHTACQQFLGKTEHEVADVALQTLEGHQRAIMGQMTVEEIYQDRQKFSHAVFEVASKDLMNMGITVVSYTIRDVKDSEGYLAALGVARTAQVQRDARIGEAQNQRDAGIREAQAKQQEDAAKYANETEVALATRDFELQKASFAIEVKTKKAEADLATDLQKARTTQQIRFEQMGEKIVERVGRIQVQEQEIARRERELEATKKRPAKARKYQIETLAEANKNKIVLEAEAKAESIRAKGEAEAYAIEQKARAEAEAMRKKAQAFKEYKDAAVVDMVLKTLPRVAAEVAHPLTMTDKITMIGDASGASKITGEILRIMAELPKTVHDMSQSVQTITQV